MQIIQFLITLATVVLVGLLGRAMWGVYMGAPWTRDATVRAYVVTGAYRRAACRRQQVCSQG
jgi:multidrug resistance efflux pump